MPAGRRPEAPQGDRDDRHHAADGRQRPRRGRAAALACRGLRRHDAARAAAARQARASPSRSFSAPAKRTMQSTISQPLWRWHANQTRASPDFGRSDHVAEACHAAYFEHRSVYRVSRTSTRCTGFRHQDGAWRWLDGDAHLHRNPQFSQRRLQASQPMKYSARQCLVSVGELSIDSSLSSGSNVNSESVFNNRLR